MSQDRYFKMCEQLGKEPNEKEIPPSWEELPEIVQIAVNIFNSLGDRVYPDIGYVGKDYTNFSFLLELYKVEHEREFLFEIVTILDGRTVKKSSEQLKRELEKLKRKSGVQEFNPTRSNRR